MSERQNFEQGSGALPVPDSTRTVIREQWEALGEPGTWWNGDERVAIAAEARSARHEEPSTDSAAIPPTARRAAALVSRAPHQIDGRVVDELDNDGLDRSAYVELVGVVARVAAIDAAALGVGAEPVALPTPQPGEPDSRTVAAARRRSAWVPMDGGAGPTTALSAVPGENRAQEELHGALYLSYAEMGDLRIVKDLARAQMETVAARTSLLNRCHF